MQAVILAAGMGKRMGFLKAKCAIPILDIPLIRYPIDALKNNGIKDIKIIVNYKEDDIKEATNYLYQYISQEKLIGTGEAIRCAIPHLNDDLCIIMPGDTVFIDNILVDFIDYHIYNRNDFSILSVEKKDPTGYGRIIRNEDSLKIVEEEYLKGISINECNTGIYITNKRFLSKYIDLIKMNEKGEYYFTDILKYVNDEKIGVYHCKSDIYGINTLIDLNKAIEEIKLHRNRELLKNGVLIMDINSTYISPDSIIGKGTIIEPGSIIYHSKIGFNNKLLGHNRIINSTIDDNNRFESCSIKDSFIGNNNSFGPFCHLRNETNIGDYNRIGNFVEIKASMIENKTNAAHLAYIGNCDCGSNVNFGCGSITVNYDGKYKHKTIIKDGAFIGCNSNLIAPIVIEEKAFIAAGSTITNNVEANSLAIARARQINKEGYNKNSK